MQNSNPEADIPHYVKVISYKKAKLAIAHQLDSRQNAKMLSQNCRELEKHTDMSMKM